MGKHEDTGQGFNPVGSNIGEIVEVVEIEEAPFIDPTPTTPLSFPLTKKWAAEQKELLKPGKHRAKRNPSKFKFTPLVAWIKNLGIDKSGQLH